MLSNELIVYFDGATEPANPGGVSTYGWIIIDNNQEVERHYGVSAEGGRRSTNNFSEYCALGFALRWLADKKWTGRLTIRGDSQVVIYQLSGRYDCNREHLRRLRDRCRELLKAIGNNYVLEWIPRNKNQRCDSLSRLAYVKFNEGILSYRSL